MRERYVIPTMYKIFLSSIRDCLGVSMSKYVELLELCNCIDITKYIYIQISDLTYKKLKLTGITIPKPSPIRKKILTGFSCTNSFNCQRYQKKIGLI